MGNELEEPSALAASTIGRRAFVGVGLASLVSSGVGYVVFVITARVLSPHDNAIFLAFWSMLFAWFGILGGLSSEATRATHAADRAPLVSGAPRMLLVGLTGGIALATLLGLSSPLWGPALFGSQFAWLAIPLCIATALYSGHATLVGVLGGRGRWGTFARLVTVDSLVRLAGVVVVALLVATTLGFAVAASVAPVTWFFALAVSPTLRKAASARADSRLPEFLRRLSHAVAAAGSSAILVVGFPILLRITSTSEVYLASAPLLLAVSLTRAPLLIPLNAYQGVAIAHFLERRSDGIRALLPVLRLLLLVGAGGAVLAWLIGPQLMIWIFGQNYEVDGWLLACLTIAASGLAALTLTGALTLAFDRHRAFSGGWLSATGVSVALLLLPFNAEVRAAASLTVGPLVGMTIHLLTLRRVAPNEAAANDD